MKEYIKEFSIIHRYSYVLLTEKMKEYSIPGRAVPYIVCIHERPGLSQEEIADELKIDKGAVARTIKMLLDEDFIERVQNPEDKRQYMIYPSERLDYVYETWNDAREKMGEILTKGISEDQLAVFDEVLSMMQSNVVDAVTETKLQEFEKMMFEKGKERFRGLKEKGGDCQA